jgi:hypothetical protein
MLDMAVLVPVRDEHGQFAAGMSGNSMAEPSPGCRRGELCRDLPAFRLHFQVPAALSPRRRLVLDLSRARRPDGLPRSAYRLASRVSAGRRTMARPSRDGTLSRKPEREFFRDLPAFRLHFQVVARCRDAALSSTSAARGDPATFRRQLADQPVGLQRVGEPRLGPAALDAGLDGPRADALAVPVEERQLAAGLIEAAGQPGALRGVRRPRCLAHDSQRASRHG